MSDCSASEVETASRALVTLHDVQAARARIAGTCLRTPVLQAPNPTSGDAVWVKAESLQRTGSFKLRGAANALAAIEGAGRTKGVVTFSAGNHGRALAYAAREL